MHPVLPVIGGAALISLSPVFVVMAETPATVAGVWRMAVGAIFLLLAARLQGRRHRAGTVTTRHPPGRIRSRRQAHLILACAAFFALDLWFWHRSILLAGPGLATLLANLQVFFVAALAWALDGERPGAGLIAAIVLAVTGLALLLVPDPGLLAPGWRRGTVFGVLTALSYAGYLSLLRHLQADRATGPLLLERVGWISALTAGLLAAAAAVEGLPLLPPGGKALLWLGAYGLLCQGLGWVLITAGLPRLPAALGGLLLLLQPALAWVWDIAAFGARVSAAGAAGLTLVLGAIWLGGLAGRARPAAGARVPPTPAAAPTPASAHARLRPRP